jgi:uncharacterized protein YgfB (UPF0149 family)
MQEKQLYRYDELVRLLSAAGAVSGPSEAHGLLSGMLCTGGGKPADDVWQEYLLGEGNTLSTAARDCISVLSVLQDEIARQYADDGFGFTMLLPDDEVPLGERTRELGRWCAGFLYGLALGGIRQDAAIPDTASEVIKDFYEISHADFVAESTDDAQEAAYMEIVEYIRMSVLLLYTEMSSMPTTMRVQ